MGNETTGSALAAAALGLGLSPGLMGNETSSAFLALASLTDPDLMRTNAPLAAAVAFAARIGAAFWQDLDRSLGRPTVCSSSFA